MTSTFSYTVSSTFPSGLYSYQLQLEIGASSITVPVSYITESEGVATIVFVSSLSGGEQTALTAVIASHIPAQSKTNVVRYIPQLNNSSTTDYAKLGRFQYQGIAMAGPFTGIDIVSNMEVGLTSYSIKIVCRNDNRTVCEKTFTNTTSAVNSLTGSDIIYQPIKPSIFEVMCKIVTPGGGKKYAFIEEILFWV